MSITAVSSSLFVGNNNIFQNRGLKSTQEKLQRQAKRDNQIAFLENQKSNLKNMKCDTVEEISRKLDLFHSYEEQIAAAKDEYNQSQMLHVMDEAKELGERIAKAVEKYAPKTPEERREELAEEALGTNENEGELTESMKEIAEMEEDIAEEMEEIPEKIAQEEMLEQPSEELADPSLKNTSISSDTEKAREFSRIYRKVDIRI